MDRSSSNYFKIFSSLSFILIAFFAIVLFFMQAHSMKLTLQNMAEDRAGIISRQLAQIISTEFLKSYLLSHDEVNMDDPETLRKLDELIRSHFENQNIVRVVLYDEASMITYSTYQKIIGRDASENVGVQGALDGQTYSKMVDQLGFDDFDPARTGLQGKIIETYIPFSFEFMEHSVKGVVEIYQDMTETEARINKLNRFFFLLVVIVSALLYILLVLITAQIEKKRTALVRQLSDQNTELEHSEKELRKSARELNFQKYAIDEHAIASATDADGNITYANDKFCEISGFTREELIGKNHRMINSGEHSPEFFRDMWNTLTNGKVWHGEVKNRKKNGDFYWVKATMVPFRDVAGKSYQYISMRTDITNRKNAEKELKKYASKMEQLAENRAQQLIHADKMATLGTLSAGVAHEINNPVNLIIGNLQIFEKIWNQSIRAYLEKANRGNEDKNVSYVLDEMPRMVKTMKEGAIRIINIVRGLGKFSRKTIPVFEPSNICEVIEAAVKLSRFDLTLKHKVKIQLDLPDDIPNIKICRQEIEQVLINLITNAGHAMEEITGRNELILIIAVSHVNNNIVIEITDNAYGMDEKTLDNIFDPFFTTKEVGKGTGLGLSICLGIIEQHRGDITATSTLGEGTTFTITLPIDLQKKERRKKEEKIIDGMRDEDRESLNCT